MTAIQSKVRPGYDGSAPRRANLAIEVGYEVIGF
jgi:hypothetical protein